MIAITALIMKEKRPKRNKEIAIKESKKERKKEREREKRREEKKKERKRKGFLC